MNRIDYICMAGAALLMLFAIIMVAVNRKRTRKILENIGDMLEKGINGNFKEEDYDESVLSYVESKFVEYLASSEVSKQNLSTEKNKIMKLISDISHQTKTPIANILLYAQLLEEQDVSEESRRYICSMKEQSEKLDFLIRSLIKTSRLENGILTLYPVKGNIQTPLEGVLEQIQPRLADKNLNLFVESKEGMCLFDEKWTREALYNIFDNAVKYTPKGGSIEVQVTEYEMFTAISIKDTGMGIEEEEQAKIFGRFYRSSTVRKEEGLGIGLYLARQIISGQGGYIKVSSHPGKGSVFSVYLPKEM